MVKDDADSIIEQAKLLLDEDVSVERRIRVARKIMEHARSIKASCMAEPAIKYGGNRQVITVNVTPIAPTTAQKQIAQQIEACVKRALAVKAEPEKPSWYSEPAVVTGRDGKEASIWGPVLHSWSIDSPPIIPGT